MKFCLSKLEFQPFSKKRFFKQIESKKKKSYKKRNYFPINFNNNILQINHFKRSNATLKSYKELVKSFLIRDGKSKRLQNLTFKSLLSLWKHYPNFSLISNINRFFFLYPFPLILKTTYPIFRKRRSKRGKKSVQWLDSTSERKYTFNFFKDFLKQDLTRNFGNNFVLTFMQLSSKRVSLLKTQHNMSIKLYDFWKRASKTRNWKIASKKKELNTTVEERYNNVSRTPLYFKIKPSQTRFETSRQVKGNFLSLNFLPGFPKKNIWVKDFFINNNLFDIKVKEGIIFNKSLIFLLKRKKKLKFLELQRLKKRFFKGNLSKNKKNSPPGLLNKKGKRLWKIQSFKRINNLKFLKQKLSPKRKKYFHKWDLRHISIGKNISIKKKVLIPEGKVIRNKLFYNFLIRKYTSNENTSFKEVHISWYLSIKKKPFVYSSNFW